MMWVFIVVLSLITPQVVFSVLTEEEVNAAKKIIRDICEIQKHPDSGLVDGLRKGKFIEEKKLQCYLFCVLSTYQLMKKDNSLDWEAGIQVVQSTAPAKIAEPASKSFANCKNAVKTHHDECIAAFEIAKCIYEDNPDNYFLP